MADVSRKPPETRWTTAQMYELAFSAAEACDRDGVRGPTLVSTEQLRAMSAVLLMRVPKPTPEELQRIIATEEVEDAVIVTETPNPKEVPHD